MKKTNQFAVSGLRLGLRGFGLVVGLLLASTITPPTVNAVLATFSNGESGSSVRGKLNAAILQTNTNTTNISTITNQLPSYATTNALNSYATTNSLNSYAALDESGKLIGDVYPATIYVDGTVTGLVYEVLLQEQTELQRQSYLGTANEIVRIEDDNFFPIAVYDGTTTGGVGLVSWNGAVLRLGKTAVTNTVDWSGWSTTGTITNNNLLLQSGEYLLSPVLTGGVANYVDQINAPGGGSSWTVTVYTNTIATPVLPPYYGQDARLRVDYGQTLPLIGDLYAGVTIPNTNGIIINSILRNDLIDQSLETVTRQFEVIREPDLLSEVARLATVQTWFTAANDYTDAEIVEYHRDTGKTVRGSIVFFGNDIAHTSSGSATNRQLEINAGGIQLAQHEAHFGFCTINEIALENTNNYAEASIYISTNGVEKSPLLEWTGDLTLMEWQRPQILSNSYPTAIGSNYLIQATIPDDDVGYYRALQKTEAQTTVLYAEHIILPNLPTSATGLPSGTLWSDSGTLKVAP